jgi:hypothetical protein
LLSGLKCTTCAWCTNIALVHTKRHRENVFKN